MASLDMDSVKDGLVIALPIMVAAVTSSAIAFFVVPFYFQTRLTPFAFSLIFVSLGAAGAGFVSIYIADLLLGIKSEQALSILAIQQEVYRGVIYFAILSVVAFFAASFGLALMPMH